MPIITLPVSVGEALDKLTILAIKLKKITNPEKKADVQKEYDVLYVSLETYVKKFAYHYRILYEINLSIWETQDLFHGKDTTLEQGAIYCNQILKENDRRFRVKAKINTLADSDLREQKGYAQKKALIYTHLGLGDMYWMNGAVRYLATDYDEVYVICKDRNKLNAKAMYEDDPTIKIVVVQTDEELQPWHLKRRIFEEQGFTVFSCGFFANKPEHERKIYNLPISFYDDLGLPASVRTTYFNVPYTAEAEELAAVYKVGFKMPYILIHQQSSVKKINLAEKFLHSMILVLDINENHYPKSHNFYELAAKAVNKPMLDYTRLAENATEIHLIESSFYCLISHLDLSCVQKKVCYDPWGGNAERLGVFETGISDAEA
jgi:hypothetical protein